MGKAILIVGVMLLLALGSGCQYARARLRDAGDCVAASVTLGPGFIVDAQATWLARLGAGYLKGERYALYYGKPSHFTHTTSRFIGLGPLLSFEWISNEPGGDCIPWIVTFVGFPIAGDPDGGSVANVFIDPVRCFRMNRYHTDFELMEMRTSCGISYLDVGFALHLGYIGTEFRIKMAEILDFLVGFTTLDVTGDDLREYPRPSAPRKEAAPALEERFEK